MKKKSALPHLRPKQAVDIRFFAPGHAADHVLDSIGSGKCGRFVPGKWKNVRKLWKQIVSCGGAEIVGDRIIGTG